MEATRSGEHLESLTARLRWIAVLAALGFLLVAAAYARIQLLDGERYGSLADNNRLRRASIEAARGLILDRRGEVLVENVPSYNLLLDRSATDDLAASLTFATAVLELEVGELREVLGRYERVPDFEPVLIAEDLALFQVARIEAATLRHPEFRIEVLQRRLYRHGPQTAHLLGYLGEVNEQELHGTDLRPGDLVGREGVEQFFDEHLRGVDGEIEVVVDSRGRRIEEFGRRPAEPGLPLRLTVDLDLQKEAAISMQDKAGAVVVLDPRDGAIRALVSAPSYDPNRIVGRLPRQEWEEIVANPRHPLQNRSLQNAYAPGSVFKIVMGIAALSEGVVDETTRFYCRGSVKLYDRRRRCHKAGGHGWVDLHDAIRKSCDVYFYLAGRDLGIERIASYSELLGLGGVTGLTLPGERPGLVPDNQWSLERRGTPWYPGETISVAIGQGPILTTPLQIAEILATVANGGHRVRPYLVDSDARPVTDLGLDQGALDKVRRALLSVVQDEGGTGRVARVPGVAIAGKTGTSQVVEQKTWTRNESLPYRHRDHAWFASFAPYEEPELVVVVFVEHGGHGSAAAAPIARAIYERYFERQLRGSAPGPT